MPADYANIMREGFYGTPKERIDYFNERLNEVATAPSAYKLDSPTVPLLHNTETRRMLYKVWWAYYDNSVFDSIARGGFRYLINQQLGSLKVGSLTGLYNPVKRAAEAYQYVFDGEFGDTLTLDPQTPSGKAIAANLLESVKKIWQWSNMTAQMTLGLRYASVLGTVVFRANAMKDSSQRNWRIFITTHHPNQVEAVIKDGRGNIQEIKLRYEVTEGSLDDPDNPPVPHTYLEYVDKRKFWMQKDGRWFNYQKQDFVDTKEEAEVLHPFGFVPFVIAQFQDVGGDFGLPCFASEEPKIVHINALATHIAAQIHRHVTATWMLEASGQPPRKIPIGDMNVIYLQREMGVGASGATMKPLVADLAISDAAAYVQDLQAELSNSMPELKATDGAFLSHQSGGTVAQLRTPAEQRIKVARTSIEASVVAVQKMALSMGIELGLWEIGSNGESAEEAFQNGTLDHRFPQRPTLPLSVNDTLTLAKAEAISDPTTTTKDKSTANLGLNGGNNNNLAPTSSTGSN